MRFGRTRAGRSLAECRHEPPAVPRRRGDDLCLRRFLEGGGEGSACPPSAARPRRRAAAGGSTGGRASAGSRSSRAGWRGARCSGLGSGRVHSGGAGIHRIADRAVPRPAARASAGGVDPAAGGDRRRGVHEGAPQPVGEGPGRRAQGQVLGREREGARGVAGRPQDAQRAPGLGAGHRDRIPDPARLAALRRAAAPLAGDGGRESQVLVAADGEGGAGRRGGRWGLDHHHPHRAGSAAGRLRAGLQPDGGVRDMGVPGVSAAAGVSPGVRRRGGGHQLQHRVRHRLELLALPALSTVSAPASLPATSSAATGWTWRAGGSRGDPVARVASVDPVARVGRVGPADPEASAVPAARGNRPAGPSQLPSTPGGAGNRPAGPSQLPSTPGGAGGRPAGPSTLPAGPSAAGPRPSPNVPSAPPGYGGGDRGWGGGGPSAKPAPSAPALGRDGKRLSDARCQQPRSLERAGVGAGGAEGGGDDG